MPIGTSVLPLQIPADHAAYAGHFPGAPVLPGVVLLDATLHALEHRNSGRPVRWQIASGKFQSVVSPGEALDLEVVSLPNGSIRFTIRSGERTVAQGLLTPTNAPGIRPWP